MNLTSNNIHKLFSVNIIYELICKNVLYFIKLIYLVKYEYINKIMQLM